MKSDIDYEILKQLRKSDKYISGEELAAKFMISRQALWKHISKLGDKGYKIVATHNLGYKLESAPDKLYPWEVKHNLKTQFIGKEVCYFDKLDSTQDYIKQLSSKQTKEGLVVIAKTQSCGRGRMGRAWVSPKGGMYFSLLLKPKTFFIHEISKIPLIIALGCINGIKKSTGLQCQVKWPNDIFLGSKKLAGILCEVDAEADKINSIIVGVGINVNSKDLPAVGTSLFLNLKKKISQVDLIKAILEELESCYIYAKANGFADLLKKWEKHCFLWGNRIKVKILDKTIEGEAAGIDENGYLLLRRDTGLIDVISSGDVTKVNVNP